MTDELALRVRRSLALADLELQDSFDRIKTIERDVSRRVEASAALAGQAKFELALEEARAAQRQLEALRLAILKDQQQQQQRGSSSASSSRSSERGNNAPSNQSDTEQKQQRQPMTTGVNLFELSIMVRSNLATQLRNNGQLEPALDLFTQLCKLAIDQTGATSAVATGSFGGPTADRQHSSQRYLLHRFGLEIGNILNEMGEHQRALKYYRLTLDRLSSQPGQRSLQIKLMNNITVALMAMNGILSRHQATTTTTTTTTTTADDETKRSAGRGTTGGSATSSTSSLSSKTNDHVTSLQLLLSDNSLETVANNSSTTASATARKSASLNRPGQMQASATTKQALNSNHHKFGLNLIVCQYENADLGGVYATLRSLVQVRSHYKRVLDFDKLDRLARSGETGGGSARRAPTNNVASSSSSAGNESDKRDAQQANNDRHGSAHATSVRPLSGHEGAISASNRPMHDRDEHDELRDKLTRRPAALSDQPDTNSAAPNKQLALESLRVLSGGSIGREADPPAGSSKDVAQSLVDERARQVVSAGRADKLERLICAKEREIRRALITSCNLAADLDRRARRRRRAQAMSEAEQRARQQNREPTHESRQRRRLDGERPSQVGEQRSPRDYNGSNSRADLNEGGPRRVSRRADVGSSASWETSALGQCVKLLATSDLYKGLTEVLLANSVSRLLTATGGPKLTRALYVLERIALKQQVGALGSNQPVSSSSINASAMTSKSQRATAQQQQASTASDCKSAMVATNVGLLHFLRKQVNISLELNERARQLEKFNAESLVNMANCQCELSAFQQAQEFYADALKIEPSLWPAHFNRMLLNLRLGRHPSDIEQAPTVMEGLSGKLNGSARQVGFDGSLSQLKMALSQLQLALLYRQSGMIQRSGAILGELLTRGGASQPPELSLAASKSLPDKTPAQEHQEQWDDSASQLTSSATRRRPQSVSAVSMLRAVLASHPYHVPTAERLIALLIQEFDYKRAISVLEDCVRNRPDQVRWHQMLAECHRRGANYTEAIKIYKHAIELFPLNESCVKSLAKLADELGLDEESAACQERLRDLSQARDASLP